MISNNNSPSFLFIPDSFKGTLSAYEVCLILKAQALRIFPKSHLKLLPAADGGEGSVDCLYRALGGKLIPIATKNPFFENLNAEFLLTGDGKTAVIETASCAGITLAQDRLDPFKATTYGIGIQIKKAVELGAKEIILCLGGSCTNDGACGLASALGVKFADSSGKVFVPTGGTLKNISFIDCSEAKTLLTGINITLMSDVDNRMYGPNGAAYVFGPQKGASPSEVVILDQGLKHLSEMFKKYLGKDVSNLEGGGAAGAMGAGMTAMFNAKLKMGIDTVLDLANFDQIISDFDYIITGEGRFDGQSLHGKLISGIALRAQKAKVPVIVIAGGIKDEEIDESYKMGIAAVFSVNRLPENFELAKKRSRRNLEATAYNIFRLIDSVRT